MLSSHSHCALGRQFTGGNSTLSPHIVPSNQNFVNFIAFSLRELISNAYTLVALFICVPCPRCLILNGCVFHLPERLCGPQLFSSRWPAEMVLCPVLDTAVPLTPSAVCHLIRAESLLGRVCVIMASWPFIVAGQAT